MSRMKPSQGTPVQSLNKVVQWPDINLPPSVSSVKGLTDEQHAAINSWCLAMKNTLNDHFNAQSATITTQSSTITELQKQVSELQKKIAS